MTLTYEQSAAVYAQQSVIVTAGAGTGKTHMLSERFLYYLTQRRFSPLQIVAVTFTEKAAMELRVRIREKVARNIIAADFAAEMEAAQISTIHALAARICREHPDFAEVPYDFTLLDELDTSLRFNEWLMNAMESLSPEIYQEIPYNSLIQIMRALLRDPITAERALAKDSQQLLLLIDHTRQEAQQQLLQQSEWQASILALNSIQGRSGDRMEDQRREVISVIDQIIKLGDNINDWQCCLNRLSEIELRGGSKKNWLQPDGSDGLEIIKTILKNLRELVRDAINAGLITLQWQPIDEQFAKLLPKLRDSFHSVNESLINAKRARRCLDFTDLEKHALKALSSPVVKRYYAERWQAFLIDEFQDVNAIQAEIIEKLTEHCELTIVGDEKQSIYGFRRADVTVFNKFREDIIKRGGTEVILSQSFRSHINLIDKINSISHHLLGNIHQQLNAMRETLIDTHPAIILKTLNISEQADRQVDRQRRQTAEAKAIADTIKDLLNNVQVHDKESGQLRAARAGDIAILTRAWQPLKIYSEVLDSYHINNAHAGGGNLFDIREAKDGIALLSALADPTDNLSLVALLRSPFFAISDIVLYNFSQTLADNSSWRKELINATDESLQRANSILIKLSECARLNSPSRVLQLADRLCGYSAIIANLPGATRRSADWRGFMALISSLEIGRDDLFALVTRLKRLINAGAEIARPMLQMEDAVSLMTIHGAKGLEWPIIILPDLTRNLNINTPPIYFEAELGAAFRLAENSTPALYRILSKRHRTREEAESRRLLYVALTRARDYLILTANESSGGILDILLPALTSADIIVENININADDLKPVEIVETLIPNMDQEILIG